MNCDWRNRWREPWSPRDARTEMVHCNGSRGSNVDTRALLTYYNILCFVYCFDLYVNVKLYVVVII